MSLFCPLYTHQVSFHSFPFVAVLLSPFLVSALLWFLFETLPFVLIFSFALFRLPGCPSCDTSRELDIPHPPVINECRGVSSKHFYVTFHNCFATSAFPRDFTCAAHLRDSDTYAQAMQVKLSACVPCVVCLLLHRPTSTEPKRNYLEVALRFLKAWKFR